MRGWLAALVAAAGVSVASGAAAQQRLDLSGGASPDPLALDIEATGALPAASWVRGCPGHVAEAPALVLDVTDARLPLRLMLLGEAAGMIVAGVDGIYRCAAAGAGRAALWVEPAMDGPVSVWPAAQASGQAVTARLLVSNGAIDEETVYRLSGADAGPLRPDVPPAFGVYLLPPAGDEVQVPVTVSSVAPASVVADPSCTGWIDPTRPDAVLRIEPGAERAALSAHGGADLTLVAVTADGQLYCDDDSIGTDPLLVFEPPAAGDVAIWVGVYEGEGARSATLRLAATAPGGFDGGEADPLGTLDLFAEPASGVHDLIAGGALSIPLVVGGEADAGDYADGCAGNIDPSRPDALLHVPEALDRLLIRASGDGDLTLLVVDPDGGVTCIDDRLGTDPVFEMAEPPTGDYLIWVGVWMGIEPEPATLLAGVTPEDIGAEPGFSVGEEAVEPMPSPFLGRPMDTALDALAIVLENPDIAGSLRYKTVEPIGRDGFVLRDVFFSDPTGQSPDLPVAEIRVESLDLAGMTETGTPGTFRIAVSGIDYAAFADAMDTLNGTSMPRTGKGETFGFELSMLPPSADAARRDLLAALRFDGRFGLSFGARLVMPEPGEVPLPETVKADGISLELTNMGFLGEMLRGQAEAMGVTPADLAALLLDNASALLAPVPVGSPAEALLRTLSEALAAADGRGVLRMTLAADAPMTLEAIGQTLDAVGGLRGSPQGLRVDFGYTPLP